MMDVLPAEHLSALIEQVRSANARGEALRIVGSGQWLAAGRACHAEGRLDIGRHSGVVDYVPGDLTLTARAGTTLGEIARVTAAEGQWLALEPFGTPSGTLGATVATASAGPLATAFGTPRDHVLGCEFVSGTGDVVRAGGRVVKNVAGFDLVRLVTGAWGTLGALTEITVRLRARPERDHTLALCLSGDTPSKMATAAWRWLRESDHAPLAAELLSPSLARYLDIGNAATLLVRLGGNDEFVRAAEGDVASLGEPVRAPVDIWHRVAGADPARAAVVRVSALPSRVGDLWAVASSIAERQGGFAHSTLALGVVRVVLPRPEDPDTTAKVRHSIVQLAEAGTVVAESLPASLWDAVAHVRPTDALAHAIRKAFDPCGVLNPGILGAGA